MPINKGDWYRTRLKLFKRKWLNNIGCLWYSLWDYTKAFEYFDKAWILGCYLDEDQNSQYVDNVSILSQRNNERAGILLNYARTIIKRANIMNKRKQISQLEYHTQISNAELKLKELRKGFAFSTSWTDLEILSIFCSIRCWIELRDFDLWNKEMNKFKEIILEKNMRKSNDKLWEVLGQYYAYCQALLWLSIIKHFNNKSQSPSKRK